MKNFSIAIIFFLIAACTLCAAENITFSLHSYNNQGEVVFSKSKKFYVSVDFDSKKWVCSTIDGSHPFGPRPTHFPMNFDDTDSTFWFFAQTPNQFATGSIARVDKVRLDGDTSFTFLMPDTMVSNSLLLDCDRPVIAAMPDGYTLELYDVYSGKKLNSYKPTSPDPWEKISSFEVSPDLSEVYVNYMYFGVTYSVATGDSLSTKNTLKTYSKDRKFFFTMDDGKFLVCRSSDSSLYHAWADSNLSRDIQYLQDPAQIFVGGIVFNFLDTLAKPDFSKAIDAYVVEINGKDYLIRKDADSISTIENKKKLKRRTNCEVFFFAPYDQFLYCSTGYYEFCTYYSDNGMRTRNIISAYLETLIGRPTDTLALFLNSSGKYCLINWVNNRIVRSFEPAKYIATEGNCKRIFYKYNDPSRIMIAEASTGIVLDSFPVSGGIAVSASPNGEYCVLECFEHHYHYIMYNTSGGWCAHDSLYFICNQESFVFSPDSRFLVVFDSTESLRVYDTKSKELVKTLRLPGQLITSIDVSSDSKHVSCGTKSGDIFIINMETGKEEAVLHGMKGDEVKKVIISPQMNYIAAQGRFESVIVWAIDFDFISSTESEFRFPDSESILASPNPFSDQTEIKFYVEQAGAVTITVRNSFGETVATKEYYSQSGEQTFSLEGAALSAGLYFCDVAAAGKTYRAKAVLVR